MASPTEIAREALDEVKELKAKLDSIEREIGQYEFLKALNRLAVIEEKLLQITKGGEDAKRIPVIDDRVDKLETRATEADRLRERVAVLESLVAEGKKIKEEVGKRSWQFVVLFVGGLITLGINIAVSFIRK